MASEPDPDRLKALEEKLKQAKGKEPPLQTNTAKGFSQGEVAWRMVIELATGIMLGSAIGYGIDVLFSRAPDLPGDLLALRLCRGHQDDAGQREGTGTEG